MPPTLLFDRSDRTRLQLTGPQRVATLNGLVTNDVVALTSGQGAYAAVLSAKGKLVADLRLFMQDDAIWVDTAPEAAAALKDIFKKYVNPRFATVTDLTETTADLGVFGDQATEIVARATGISSEALAALGVYEQLTGSPRDTETPPVTIARVPDLGIRGYELFISRTHLATMHRLLVDAGAAAADATEWHALRIAAGWPAWGIDIDETTLPQEANFDALNGVSYTKGCYVGQETVARIHFRGHVNKTLRRLTIDGNAEPPFHAALIDADGTVVGDLRSVAGVAQQPTNVLIGIAMVRREVGDGATLTARWEGGETSVQVLGPADGNAKGATN